MAMQSKCDYLEYSTQAIVPEDRGSTMNFYTWGQDLSGTLQGAGGVGGLLIVSINNTNCFPAFDGNGNVMGLVNASDGTVVAEYEYSPAGGLLVASGVTWLLWLLGSRGFCGFWGHVSTFHK
jgi:hypothetical protein